MSSQKSAVDSHVDEESTAYLRVKDIRKTFNDGEVVAVDNVTLDIEEDEFVVLLGPSGCGKTTTLRCIAGLEIPDSGTISVGNNDITHQPPKDRDLAFVFQDIALFPHKTVKGNMQFGLDMKTDLSKEEKTQRVNDAADILGIRELLDRKPSELSGGQQQRVSVGRAMVMEPAAFLLDEPFSALDANLRDKMRTEIKKIQRDLNKATIFVTHDQEEAMTLGDKIVIMKDGEIQQIGSPYEIYSDPQNLFVSSFIGSPSSNILDCEVSQSGDDITLNHELFTLKLPTERLDKVPRIDGDTVKLAIRPEHVLLNKQETLFEGEITVIEPHGSQDAIFIDCGGTEIRAVTSQNRIESENVEVSIAFDRDKIWLFHENGDRIL